MGVVSTCAVEVSVSVTSEPLVTIGIPTRNRSGFILNAVNSALLQTYENIEIVVSDNCSDDDTLEQLSKISDSRVRILRQRTNIGMVANFNACLAHASGEFFLMLSDDDLLNPDAVAMLVKPFGSGRDVGATWCPVNLVDGYGKRLWRTQSGPNEENSAAFITGLLRGTRGPRFCSVMIRTDDARGVGGYLERCGVLCDAANWGLAALKHELSICVSEPLVTYTVHQKSHTSSASIKDWQNLAWEMDMGFISLLKAEGREMEAARLMQATRIHQSNVIITVLLQLIGKPGWIRMLWCELLRSPSYLLTPSVIGRFVKDGWKLLRLGAG